MDKIVVAISRANGSGGRIIGQLLAAKLGVPCYDRSIIELSSEKSGLSKEYMEHLEEQHVSSFLFNLASASAMIHTAAPHYDVPVSYKAFSVQSDIIRELAEKSSCVIVGRCSEFILRENPHCVKVFIYADKKDRIKRISESYGITPKESEAKLAKTDRARANYYKDFTGEKWGDPARHDLCINTSRVGLHGAADTIYAYIKALENKNK